MNKLVIVLIGCTSLAALIMSILCYCKKENMQILAVDGGIVAEDLEKAILQSDAVKKVIEDKMVGYIKYEDELRLSNAYGGYRASVGTCGHPSGKDGACSPPLLDVVYGDFTKPDAQKSGLWKIFQKE